MRFRFHRGTSVIFTSTWSSHLIYECSKLRNNYYLQCDSQLSFSKFPKIIKGQMSITLFHNSGQLKFSMILAILAKKTLQKIFKSIQYDLFGELYRDLQD